MDPYGARVSGALPGSINAKHPNSLISPRVQFLQVTGVVIIISLVNDLNNKYSQLQFQNSLTTSMYVLTLVH